MKNTISLKHKIIMCLLALLITGLFGMGNVLAQTPVASVKIKEDETVEKAFTSLEDAWDYATGLDKETLPGTTVSVKDNSRRTNYAEITLYDNCTTNKTLTVPAGVTVKINLNGKTIDHQGNSAGTNTETDPGSVFNIEGERNAPGKLILDGESLTETDVIKGGNAADKGGGILVNEYGELALYDVKITGNTAKNRGGGVFLTSDGTGSGKMTVGGKVVIDGNVKGGAFSGDTLTGDSHDDLTIGGEDGIGMDVDGISADPARPLSSSSDIAIADLPREKVMRDPERVMMTCFKNYKDNFVFRYKNIFNADYKKSGDYVVMVPGVPEPSIQDVSFTTAGGEDIEPVGKPVVDTAAKTITVTLNTGDDLTNLIAQISTTQEVMIEAKDDDPVRLPLGRQDFGLYAGSFAPADYSGEAGRTFVLYGYDRDGSSHQNESEEWTVKVRATKRTVTFDTMGGGALTNTFPDSIVVEKGKRFNDIQDPKGGLPKTAGTDFVAFPGRALEGWYFDKTLQRRVTGEEVINNSMTLYAKWYVREFPINYFMTGTPNNQENPAYFNVNSGNFTIKNPQGYENNQFKDGKLFIGWSYKDFHNQKVGIGNTLSPQIPSGSFINASTASLDYTPQYMTQQHNVVLDFGGAAQNKNVMVEHGNTFNANDYIPQDQSLPTGAKWLTDINNHESDCNNQRITTDTTLYAAYALTLNATEGNFSNDSIKGMQRFYAINDDYTSFLSESDSIPSRAGDGTKRYVFDGWYTDLTGGTKVNCGVMPSHDMTLYAHWLEVPVNSGNTTNTWETVRFDTGGVDMPAGAHGIALKQGSTQIDASYFNFDAKPTRNGYTFAGWYTAEGYNADGSLNNPSQNQIWNGNSGPQSLSLPECFGDPKDLTLYAKWEQSQPQTVNVTVNHYVMQADGSFQKIVTKTKQSISLSDGPIAKIPLHDDALLKSDFGISDDTTFGKVVVKPHDQYIRVDTSGEKTVNYYYIRKSFPYFYQYNGTPEQFIDTSSSTKNGYYPYGYTITISHKGENQLLHGRYFSHWEREVGTEVGGTNPNPDKIKGQEIRTQMPADLLSMKPVTTPYSGKLNINLDGGKLDDTDANANPTVNSNQITFTGKTGSFTMPTPKKEGYEFVGWRFSKKINNTDKTFTANPLIINTYEEIDNRTTYTAVWKKTDKTYSVDFNLNGHGAPQPKSQTDLAPGSKLPYDCKVVIKNVKATGYNDEDDEVDWYKDSACTQKFDVDNDAVTENMTLYAKWTPQKYTLPLNADGGSLPSGQAEKMDYTVQSQPITLKNPTKPGKTFAGWTGTGLSKPTINVTIPEGSMGNRTYKATWTTGLYTVKFNTQGHGKAPATQKVLGDDRSKVTKPENPTEAGSSFDGWYTDANCVRAYNFDRVLTSAQLNNGELTLYAKWTAIPLTITLNANGGKFNDRSDTVTHNAHYGDTPIHFGEPPQSIYDDAKLPTREDYDFVGWYTKSEGGDFVDGSQALKDNVTYYAGWMDKPDMVVKFETFGGSTVPPQIIKEDRKATRPTTDPTKTGYTFGGWYQDKKYETEFNFDTPIIQDTTIYAKWNAVNYHIDADPNGGEITSTEKQDVIITTDNTHTKYQYTFETPTFSVDRPTRTGYTFTGWSWKTGDSSEAPTRKAMTYTVPKGSAVDQAITANWQIDQYSINYDLNGGKMNDGESNPASYTVETNSFTLINPTREGYIFAGWSGTEIDEGTPSTSVTINKGSTGNRAYKANWTKINYAITYDLAGGSLPDGKTNPETYTIESDTIVLNNPTRTGYTFAGWTGTGLSGPMQKVTIPKGSTENKEFTATWTPITYNISYDLDGGKIEGSSRNPTTYTVEDNNITLINPTKKGYNFAGWTGSNGNTPETSVTINTGSTGDRSYKANWTPHKYTLNLNPNDGQFSDGSTESKTVNNVEYNSVLYGKLPMNLKRDGHYFCGWNDKPDGKGKLYTSNMKMPALANNGDTLTLTAQWGENRIIYFDINPDTDEGDIQQIPAESGYAQRPTPDPTRNHYTFTGWYADPDCTEPFDFENTKITDVFTVIYAGWIPINYDIDYDLRGGALPEDEDNPDYYNIEDYFILTNPEKTGHTFAGWTGSNGDTAQETVVINGESILSGKEEGPVCNLSYTANWIVKSYKVTFNNMGKGTATDVIPSQEYGSTITKPNDPTETGYTFDGWYKDENLTDKWDFAKDTMPDHDLTLYAKWRAEKVAVKVVHQRMNLSGVYDQDETLIETEELRATADSAITPAPKTYEGFTSPPAQTVSVNPDGTTEITYQYERNRYILVLNDDENLVDYTTPVENPMPVDLSEWLMNIFTGTQLGPINHLTTDTGLYYYEQPLQFNCGDNIPSEYKWYGWIMENEDGDWLKLSDAKNITMTMPAEDITVEPMIVDAEFNITYDLAGGSLPADKTNPSQYTYGENEFTLNNPTRSGYIFTGWTGGGLSTPTTTVTITKTDIGDRHYTANWRLIPPTVRTVTFDFNDERVEPQKVSVTDGAKVQAPEVPKLDDRVFEYWMTKDGEPYDFEKPVKEDMTLYAKWQDNEPEPEPEKPIPTIYYRGHVQNIGWQTYQGSEWLADTDTVSYIGTTGRALRLEAMEIAVPSGYTVTGFAHIQNRGDTDVEKLPDGITVDGEPYDIYRFGTTGRALRMEAIDFDILKDGKSITMPDGKGPVYRVHIQNGGWQGTVRGGSFAGTRGGSLRLEAMSFSVIR